MPVQGEVRAVANVDSNNDCEETREEEEDIRYAAKESRHLAGWGGGLRHSDFSA